MATTRATQLANHRKSRRADLLVIASEVISERGIHTVTMDEISARAGVSKVIFYRYFGTKQKLVDAVLTEIVDQLLEADDIPARWWTERLERTLSVVRRQPNAMRLLVRHAAHDPEFGHHFERLRRQLVDRSKPRLNEILGTDPPEISTHFLASAITNFLLDTYVLWIEEDRADADPYFLAWVTRSVRDMSRAALPHGDDEQS